MRRVWSIVLAIVLLLSLCACGTTPSYKGTIEELDEIVNGIAKIPVGTMGVSMIITAQTVELLDWCEVSAVGAEDLSAEVKAYYDALGADAQMMFLDQVLVTVNCVANLSDNELRANLLEAAGIDKKQTWSEKSVSLASSIDDLLP